MTCELQVGEIVTVRDFSQEDMSEYQFDGGLMAKKKKIATGETCRINFSKQFIGKQYLHVGFKPVYEDTPLLLALEPVSRYGTTKLHIPGEFIEHTGNRIIDMRKLPNGASKFVVAYLAEEDDHRRATYNTHGRNGNGEMPAKNFKPEWFAENAVHMFLNGVSTKALIQTMWLAMNKARITCCPYCRRNVKMPDAVEGASEDKLEYVCQSCLKVSKIGPTLGSQGQAILRLLSIA